MILEGTRSLSNQLYAIDDEHRASTSKCRLEMLMIVTASGNLPIHVPLRLQAVVEILFCAHDFLWYPADPICAGTNAVKLPC